MLFLSNTIGILFEQDPGLVIPIVYRSIIMCTERVLESTEGGGSNILVYFRF